MSSEKKIVGYARVQKTADSNDLSQQVKLLKEAGATEIMFDITSAGQPDRPQFNKLLEMLKQSEVKEIIVTDTSRLSRSLSVLKNFLNYLESSKTSFRVLGQGKRMTVHQTKFLMNVLEVLLAC
ncbi:recombinase family protein [Egbenema bharatensis]|uniref:recombinase family protein n=1 Tax=Egbenema bharatensis TaxID=3463334 RepID=UPI003A8B1FA4